jgi:hypothetical protein
MSAQPQYEYSDGNSNLYILTSTELKYVPVKPENSSSGVYDGGEAKSISITSVQFSEIQSLLEQALNKPDIHMENRIMMSGKITSLEGSTKKQCIFKPGSSEIKQIEDAMKKILN